jgi:hypothetical protein
MRVARMAAPALSGPSVHVRAGQRFLCGRRLTGEWKLKKILALSINMGKQTIRGGRRTSNHGRMIQGDKSKINYLKMKETRIQSGFIQVKNRYVVCLTLCMGIVFSGSARAQLSPLPGLGFKLGDDVTTVQAALNTKMEVEPEARNPSLPSFAADPNKGKTSLHLRTRGVWVFFNPAGRVETIRLDAPYSGSALGIKIGDSLDKVTSALGKPVKKPPFVLPGQQSLIYVLDDAAYVRFDVTDDGVQTIFIIR